MRNGSARRVAVSGLLTSLMLVLGLIERQFPLTAAIPGIKLGLANSVLIYALYMLGVKQSIVLMLLKAMMSWLIYTNMQAMFYSLAGGVLSLLAMIALSRIKGVSVIGVSALGAVGFNIGQILMAVAMLHTPQLIVTYLPVLMVSGVATGVLTGVVAQMVMKHLKVIEKKYDVNGVKTNYFSQLFLQCHGSLSPKSKLAIVAKAVDDVQKKFYHESEQFEVQMETKSIINQALEEDGGFAVPVLIDKIFKEQEEMKEQVIEKLDKYHLTETEVEPQNPATTRKYGKQNLITDTGIEIRIPMEQYQNKDKVDFITNPDGTISVLIKNVGSIISK